MGNAQGDWVAGSRSFVLAWGVPAAAMLASSAFGGAFQTLVWVIALAWMGGACILNARTCGRTHCRFTGPFFLAMTFPVLAYGLGLVPLGSAGWAWLGAAILLGNAALWWGSERIWGKYWSHRG